MESGGIEGKDQEISSSPSPTPPSITLEEWRGSSSAKLYRTAVITADPSSLALERSGSRWHHFWRKILEAFVPEGFPGSVTPDYVPFQVWDSLQGLSTYIRSMLSTQALLGAIGVGEKSATVIGATFQGSNLDSNAKMWRLVADFMNDLGMLMDLVSPLFPSAFVAILCLGSLSRAFTGVASGATRAALTQHFALENNAADISAKEGSQETMATMIGMALGMLMAHVTRGHPIVVWVSFLPLTMFHMYANYKAVQCLSLNTLNNERSSILLQYFMQNGKVLSPQEVSRREHVFPVWASWHSSNNAESLYRHVYVAVRASSLKHSDMMELSRSASTHYRRAKYLLLERKGVIHVINHKEATPADILQSYVHALVLTNLVDRTQSLHTESRLWMDEHYPVFIVKLKSAGWATERLLSPSVVWRADWFCSPSDEKIN
ncbi:protein root UVB sensitive 3 isoform X2 [Phoenix dactylifera]|uniref:Protein root UVB sensitive 3 isoform X2 n=1 Tax=Phoenix dactylifera TaxID=42345 RepID=A0A8B9B2M4_PHODC|nr:protein root UVB sensitive 3 isoform X2 [Phoenix dactylifera]